MNGVRLSAAIHERHGFQVTIALTAEPAPGAPLDTLDVVHQMHAAGHRLAAELWAAADPGVRWAIDVSYARVVLELTEGESAHLAIVSAQRACAAAGISLLPAARPRPPAKAKAKGAAPAVRRRRAVR